jgi:phosphoglucomutase/phosphomannomutase
MHALDKKIEELPVDDSAKKRIAEWLSSDYDQKTRDEVEALITKDPKAAVDAFYTTLSFGTGGMRGIMGVGSNRMNAYTVSFATQGLANYLKKVRGANSNLSVAIGYDSRNHSKEFATISAHVLAGNGIKVYLFEDLRPTPLVSFACRYKQCSAAIMVTASHNPPEYNGYKVYWSDGGQVLPPHDVGIIREVERIQDPKDVRHDPSRALIEIIGSEVDHAYLHAIRSLQLYPKNGKSHGKELSIIYSNLHGTGITEVPEALIEYGFSSVSFVEEQKKPDGNFPTTRHPNPEEAQALELGIQKMIKNKADLFIATDPDCDRMGAVVLHENKPVILNGNQLIAILVDGICKAYTEEKKMPKKPAFVKSIVTTDLFTCIATNYGGVVFEILPGFKYVAEKIRDWEQEPDSFHFVFGGEESYGSLAGTVVRDKDAVLASCLLSEIVLKAKQQNKTLVHLLDDLYVQYGYFAEHLMSINFADGQAGKDEQKKIIEMLRKNRPQHIGAKKVLFYSDLHDGFRYDMRTHAQELVVLPRSDVLIFELEDGSKIIIRPSGTEPKMKLYFMCHEKASSKPDLEQIKRLVAERIKQLEQAVRTLILK